jgi:hypothetical protein
MRSLPCVAVLLLAALPLHAADEPRPNTLTPKEVADGWILLSDGQTTFGWAVNGEVEVSDGVLRLGGEKETTARTTTGFGDAGLRLEYRTQGGKHTELRFDGQTVSLEDKPVADGAYNAFTSAHTARAEATAPVELSVPAGCKLSLRSVKLRPLGLTPIFNGKDLTGWKKYEGDARRAKSNFYVSDDGNLCIKNGPGDLQTTGAWGNFVLQVECISNGKHLNSGVFFRCLPGQYQNGYEAQIQNGFTKVPPHDEVTVEEYDPQTHKLTGKKKVKTAADDYGTGAIYRRVPARFAVAKDHEWFTMTVVADGRHIATWVNGVQQVDWTDNRPPNDNPRNGCRLEKGPISLQGHDPTTDLCFRNIRIAELPTAEKK